MPDGWWHCRATDRIGMPARPGARGSTPISSSRSTPTSCKPASARSNRQTHCGSLHGQRDWRTNNQPGLSLRRRTATQQGHPMGHALIVEDDTDAARMMAQLVANEGFSAATAQSLREARRQMAMQQPDVVLLDLKLPDGNGMALLDETDLIGNSEVVLMTGHASLETSIQALRFGAADYLIKPVSARQLQSILSRVMKPSILKDEV